MEAPVGGAVNPGKENECHIGRQRSSHRRRRRRRRRAVKLLQVNTLYRAVLFFTGIVAVTSNCSFPYTHNGGLYYSCTENIPDVSTDDEPFACIDDYATAISCDVPSGTRRPSCQGGNRSAFYLTLVLPRLLGAHWVT